MFMKRLIFNCTVNRVIKTVNTFYMLVAMTKYRTVGFIFVKQSCTFSFFVVSGLSPPEMKRCNKSVGGVEGLIDRGDIEEEIVKMALTYVRPLDCMWVITVEVGWKVSTVHECTSSRTQTHMYNSTHL